jgi:hypothetical protein
VKPVLRRLGLGLGAALLTAGIVSFAVGHEAVGVVIALGGSSEAGEVAHKALGAAVPLTMFGAGFLGCSLLPLREKKVA